MRKALNENPMVQIGVLAVCAVAFAVILFTTVLKKDEPATGAASTVAPTTAATTPAPADPAVAAAPTTPAPADTVPGAPSTTAPPAGGTPADGLLPSKGLPENVLVAFAKNQTIALLVVDKKGPSDKQVERYTQMLRSRDDVDVFIVDVRDIAKYARITAGVNVSRTPALVVVRPRKLTGSVPTATVSYGFRGPRSVNQAIDDAIYKGKQIQAYP
jgi:hypothetical protein